MLFCVMSFAHGKPNFYSTESVDSWMTHYYQHPQPQNFLVMLDFASKKGMLAEEFRWSTLTGFTAGVIHEHPELADSLAQMILKLHPNQRQPLVLGLLYSNKAASRSALKKLAQQIPEYKLGIDNDLRMQSTELIRMLPLDNNPSAIDAYWGYFMATGSPVIVERIIGTLSWLVPNGKSSKQTSERMLVARSAEASLIIWASEHARVMRICQRQARTKQTTAPLRLVILQAKKRQNSANKKRLAK